MPPKHQIRWKLMLLIQKCIQKCNGQIFGGTPRDRIIHDHYATLFYKDVRLERHMYANPTFHEQTKLRLTVPSDIDCYMQTSNISSFKKTLLTELLYFEELSTQDANIYFKDCPLDLKITKMKVTFSGNPLIRLKMSYFDVHIDIIHSENNYEPPFGKVDFECNAIILTSDNGYKLSNTFAPFLGPKEKLDKMNNIICDIVKKETYVADFDIPRFRIYKMLQKGWKIKSKNMSLFIEQKPEDHCYICHEEFAKESKPQIKFHCCNGRMHTDCLRRFLHFTDRIDENVEVQDHEMIVSSTFKCKLDYRYKCAHCRCQIMIIPEDIQLITYRTI